MRIRTWQRRATKRCGLAEVADLAESPTWMPRSAGDVELAEDGLDSAELDDFDVAAVDVDLDVEVDVVGRSRSMADEDRRDEDDDEAADAD